MNIIQCANFVVLGIRIINFFMKQPLKGTPDKKIILNMINNTEYDRITQPTAADW